jgi:hypothetical protein
MKGYDPDGIARTEADHFMKCPGCGQWFDMRDLGQSSNTSTTRRLRWRRSGGCRRARDRYISTTH